jgi:uncharacterized protein (UPF0332 family)
MSVIHSSYHAIFYADRAVLSKSTGDAPKRHDCVIQQFGLLVRELDDAIRTAGKTFNLVQDDRTATDYDEGFSLSPGEAREALRAAAEFLELCGARYGSRGTAA